MKKQVYFFVTGLVIGLCILLIGGYWFWSLGDVHSVSPHKASAELQVEKGAVYIRHTADATWEPVSGTTTVAVGDEIRTDQDGQANIDWGHAVTRIDAQTMMRIDEAPASASVVENVRLRLTLENGRMWSRVQKLLDLNSTMEVHDQALVATVRGTAFGVESNSGNMKVSVTDSVVDVMPASATSTVNARIKEGFAVDFDSTGAPTSTHSLTQDDEWVKREAALDDAGDQDSDRYVERSLRDVLPRGPRLLTQSSERLHLFFARSEERPVLQERYVKRRLAEIALGSPENANRANIEVTDLLAHLPSEAHDGVMTDIDDTITLLRHRLDVDPSSAERLISMYRIRQLAASQDPAEQLYLRLVTIDDGIDFYLKNTNHSEADRQTLLGQIDGAEAALKNLQISDEKRFKFVEKIIALRLRLSEQGNSASNTSPSTAPSVNDPLWAWRSHETPTSSGATRPSSHGQDTSSSGLPPGSVTSTQTPPPCVFVTFLFQATPNKATVGQSVELGVLGQCPDYTMHVVSDVKPVWTVHSQDGSVQGNVFTPSRVGSLPVKGVFSYGGKDQSVSGFIGVTAAPAVARELFVTADGPTNLTTGQNSPLEAKVEYSDGTFSYVTPECVWSTSQPNLGYVSAGRFYALSGTGTDAATCAYTPSQGTTLRGSVTFTITLDPSLTPSGGPSGKPRSSGAPLP